MKKSLPPLFPLLSADPAAPAGRAFPPPSLARLATWSPWLRCAGAAVLLHIAACGAAPPGSLPAPMAAPAPAASAAASAPSASASSPAAPASAIAWRQVQAELADPSCDSAQQCHSSPAGAKACGGPDRYVAWSSKHNDGARLRQLLDQYAQARRAEDKAGGMMSTCTFVADPGASCQAGRCTLNSTVPGAVAAPPNAQ